MDLCCYCGNRTIKGSGIWSNGINTAHLMCLRKYEYKIGECSICFENKNRFYNCNSCSNSICRDCDQQVNKCPYCREQRPVISKKTIFDL